MRVVVIRKCLPHVYKAWILEPGLTYVQILAHSLLLCPWSKSLNLYETLGSPLDNGGSAYLTDYRRVSQLWHVDIWSQIIPCFGHYPLQNVQQHPWPLRNKCQQHHHIPSGKNQKYIQKMTKIPCMAKLSTKLVYGIVYKN